MLFVREVEVAVTGVGPKSLCMVVEQITNDPSCPIRKMFEKTRQVGLWIKPALGAANETTKSDAS
jgi:hypothetical protein